MDIFIPAFVNGVLGEIVCGSKMFGFYRAVVKINYRHPICGMDSTIVAHLK